MEEIKRLQRLSAWQLVLDRYSILRRHLIRVEQLNPALTEIQRRQIARAISQFRIIETKVEEAMSAPENGPADAVAFNRIVSAQIDAIERIMTAIKQAGV